MWRAEKSAKLKLPGDDRESALLPKSHVISQAKYEKKRSKFMDKDPVRALTIMKAKNLRHTIHSIFTLYTSIRCILLEQHTAQYISTIYSDK